ncbi:MAG: hypothetical protein JNK49_09155 [Planctomycetes bacterium]|nr:hypothetical protein [Planctomycetota bacterium]
MNSPTRSVRSVLLAACAFATACSGVPTRTFQIDAIDVEDQPVPCIVVVDGDWAQAAERGQVVNIDGKRPLAVTVAFPRPEANIIVAAVPVDAAGKPEKLPKSREESRALTEFLSDYRDVRLTDPDRTLFILRRK